MIFKKGDCYWSKTWNSDGSSVWPECSGVFDLPRKGNFRPFDPNNHTYDWRVELGIFKIYRCHSVLRSMIAWEFSYWTLFPLLTLLSAYLILWKPRQTLKPDAESATNA
jgi:hypothetical protein